ncbi:unnamed protein product [Arctogadus glacialis]
MTHGKHGIAGTTTLREDSTSRCASATGVELGKPRKHLAQEGEAELSVYWYGHVPVGGSRALIVAVHRGRVMVSGEVLSTTPPCSPLAGGALTSWEGKSHPPVRESTSQEGGGGGERSREEVRRSRGGGEEVRGGEE